MYWKNKMSIPNRRQRWGVLKYHKPSFLCRKMCDQYSKSYVSPQLYGRTKSRNCRLTTKNSDYQFGWAILTACRQLPINPIFILPSENYSPNLTCYLTLRVHNINGPSTVPPLCPSLHSTNIPCGLSQEKTPWKDPEGSLQILRDLSGERCLEIFGHLHFFQPMTLYSAGLLYMWLVKRHLNGQNWCWKNCIYNGIL